MLDSLAVVGHFLRSCHSCLLHSLTSPSGRDVTARRTQWLGDVRTQAAHAMPRSGARKRRRTAHTDTHRQVTSRIHLVTLCTSWIVAAARSQSAHASIPRGHLQSAATQHPQRQRQWHRNSLCWHCSCRRERDPRVGIRRRGERDSKHACLLASAGDLESHKLSVGCRDLCDGVLAGSDAQ